MPPELLPPTLTEEQRQAILHAEGPLLLIAGPGAGKTDVIVRRVAHLVLEQEVEPQHILVTTFTNKAADELRNRLWPYLDRRAHELHISTIHSLCQTLLEQFPSEHSWGKVFEVLDDREQFLFVFARLRELGLNGFPKARLGDFLSDVLATFNLCTDEMVDPDRFRSLAAEKGSELLGLKKETPEAIEEYVAVAEAYGRYCELLRGEGLMDFAHLQKAVYEMLTKSEEVRSQVADRFRFLLVDEYQDTNRLQVLLLKEIARPRFNICAVGDDDQSIYRFRGATVRSFLRFEEDFTGARTIPLDKNFRATPELVEAGSALILHNASHRREKALTTYQANGLAPILLRAETCAEEAEAVASALAEARRGGALRSYGDAAILFRSVRYHASDYLDALDRHGVPYVVGAEGRFFDREDVLHVRDLMTFCGWKKKWDPRFLDGKLLELDPQTIEAVARWKEDPSAWREDAVLVEAGIADPDDRRALRELAAVRVRTQEGEVGTLLELFYELLRATGYFERCCSSAGQGPEGYEAESALLNLGQFSGLLAAFQRHVRTQNTYRFGEYLRTLPSHSLDSLRPDPPDEAVRIMTVHQAKGLEFPLVVIGSAMKGRFPGRFNPPRYPVPPEMRLSGEHDDKEANLRDQRRLFYVAMTRAQDCLLIGAPEKVAKRGGGISPFVQEIGLDRFAGLEPLRAGQPISSRPPKVSAPERRRLSYSAIHAYLLCPLQYKLLHDCNFSVPQVDVSRFGQVIHRVLEALHRRALEGERITPSTASLVLDEFWIPIPGWKADHEAALKERGRDCLARYCEAHADRFERVRWVEEPVEFDLDPHLVLTGRMDLACGSERGLEVIDFKVRSRKGLDAMRPDLQVHTYALACQEARGESVDRLVIHLLMERAPGSDVVIFEWNPGAAAAIRERLSSAAEGIRSGCFDPSPGPHCGLCDFQKLCPPAMPGEDTAATGLEEASRDLSM